MLELRKERRYAVILLIVSIAVLGAGSLIRKFAATPKPPAPAPPDFERLQRLTAERRLRDLSAYLADAAAMHAKRVLPTGLVWDSATVLTPPFTVRRIDTPNTAAPPVNLRLRPGDWLLAVARDRGGKLVFTHGIYQGQTRQTCGSLAYEALDSDAVLTPSLIGGGLFSMDGALAGFIGECDGHPIPIAASTVAEAIAHQPTEAELLEQRYGLRLASDPPGLVTSVWADSPAAGAGLEPGDVVDPGELPAPRFTVRRRGRSIRLSWPELTAVRGLSFDGVSPVIRGIEPDSPAAKSNLAPGDRILQVGPTAVATAAAAARAIDRVKSSLTLTVERRGRRMETLLQP
jgi:hypothetical protein